MDSKARMFRILSAICILSLLIAGLATTSQKGSAAGIVIDNFDDTNSFAITGITGTTGAKSFNVGTSVAIGGIRKIKLTMGTVTGTKTITLATNTASGNLTWTPETGAQGVFRVAYDGTSEADNAYTLNKTGISPAVDLTNSGVDNMLYVSIPNDDLPAAITVDAYSSATNCSRLTLRLPGGVNTSRNPLAVVFPFADFTTVAGCSSGVANFAAITAIEIYVTAPLNLNLSFNLLSGGTADYGDANLSGGDSYKTTLDTSGSNRYVAGHVIDPALLLGTTIDSEHDGQRNGTTTNANGDDLNGSNDEDGVLRTNVPWTLGAANGGTVNVRVTDAGCLYGWIDWGMDGTFDNFDTTPDPVATADRIINGQEVSAVVGEINVSFPVPSDAPEYVMARFRLYPRETDSHCVSADTDGNLKFPDMSSELGNGVLVLGGEVEDYYWKISSTTAVNVTNFRSSLARPLGLELLWNSVSEADLTGFNLYRTAPGGSEVKVNPALIAAQTPGESDGNAYAFYDTGAVAGVKYTYRLEILQADLSVSDYGTLQGGYWQVFAPVLQQ